MYREMERDAYDLASEYEEMIKDYNFKPDREKFPYPKVGTALDREKSIRWNEEEVARQRAAYEEEVKRLNKAYHEMTNEYESDIKEALSNEYDISAEETDLIWAKAYQDGHSYGMKEIYSHFIDLAELYQELRNVKKKRK